MSNKAVAYARVSGKGQIDGDGFPRQIEAIRRYAASHDYELLAEYQEKGVPGKTDEDERPAFQEMIAALLGNGCRVIIVEGLDRLAREYRIQEQLIIYIASKGLSLISANTGENITEAMMGDPMRRALVQIQGIFAELDKNLVVAKLRKARERKRLAGHRVEGRRPFGVTATESATIEYMRALRRRGMKYADIAEALNCEERQTRTGKPWHPGSVQKILARQNVTTTKEATDAVHISQAD